MNFLDFIFFVFIIPFFVIYYLVPAHYRYIVIFVGSYIFYGYSKPIILLTLVLATLISYLGGIAIQKCSYSKLAYVLSFLAEIILLIFYKYLDFVIANINSILIRFHSPLQISTHFDIVLPIGLSFIVFQACTYLSDVYRKKIPIETNIIRYAAFVSFFPTVLSGPIQKARNLLPQIKTPSAFDYEQAQKGILLFVWGLFEKIMVANKLMQISFTVLSDYLNRSSAEILIGAICFSIYIYADFSSYSDMARGIAKIMGINVGKNFNNPYLSKTTAEFWNRWHISLNEWFIENVYIPLGGNRKGVIRKYINMMIIFGISGLWHGADWHFVAWGLINGLFVVIGQILKPLKKRAYAALKVSEDLESIVFVKRIIVFVLITLTWVFFRADIVDSLQIWEKLFHFDFVSLFNPALFNIGGTAAATFIVIIVTGMFIMIQCCRVNEHEKFLLYQRQPLVFQCLAVAVIICICVFGACATDANVDTQFLYFQF